MNGSRKPCLMLSASCWLAVASLTLFLAALAPESRAAAVIVFTATNVADTTPGEDLWLYEYHVSDFTFENGEGFTITFDRTLFTKLQNPPPLVNGDWDVLTLQPDLALSSNGFYDALALRAAPSLANDFRVTAVWLGTAGSTPGAQPFTIYDASFTPIAQSQTVPEPAAATFIIVTLFACAAWRRARSGDIPVANP